MLRLNRRTEYAFRVMSFLASGPDGVRVSTRVIEKQMLIPRPFLIRVISDLSRGGLIKSYPGRNGGLLLARPAERISLKDIYQAIEGSLRFYDCTDRPQKCALNIGCKIRLSFCQLQARLVEELDSISIGQLTFETSAIETFFPVESLDSRLPVE
jgi:Rrf2 family protein